MKTEEIRPSKKDKILVYNALKIANSHTSGGRVRMIAMLEKGGRILSLGKNKFYKKGILKHPIYQEKGIHAELSAIVQFEEEVHNATLIVAGIGSSGFPIKTTKPCDICMELIYQTPGINKVLYLENNEIKKLKINR